MSATPPLPPDDPLARAEEALRRVPAPPGPPAETVARTLAALHAGEAKPIFVRRRIPMALLLKIAAAALVAAGGLWYFTGLGPSEATLAFADVANKLRDAHTLAYRMTVRSPELKQPVTTRVLFKEPGLMRSEGPFGQVGIFDLTKHKSLLLEPKTKTAVELVQKGAGVKQPTAETDPARFLERLRQLAEKQGKPAGKKQIDGVTVQGFRVEEKGQDFLIWADPKTKQPVLVETTIPVGKEKIQATVSDIQIDAKLEDSLFRMDIPEGYKAQKMELEVGKPEEDVIRVLRAFAKKSDGQFPKRLEEMLSPGYMTKLFEGEKHPKGSTPPPEFMQLMTSLVHVGMFRQTLQGGYGYRGEGVKLGDKDKIVFWYKPEGAKEYRAVFGDLHAADVPADRLPK
jgi:outer membrane lipoprotein-sorting protein